MMKSNRDNFIFYLTQIVPVIVALVISIIIYRYWSDNNKACLALTWAAIIFLFLCFYNIIFKKQAQWNDYSHSIWAVHTIICQ